MNIGNNEEIIKNVLMFCSALPDGSIFNDNHYSSWERMQQKLVSTLVSVKSVPINHASPLFSVVISTMEVHVWAKLAGWGSGKCGIQEFFNLKGLNDMQGQMICTQLDMNGNLEGAFIPLCFTAFWLTFNQADSFTGHILQFAMLNHIPTLMHT